MKRFLVDLHIHTLLSPCAELEMSPQVIVRQALAAGLDAIAICDHNTTLQTAVVRQLGHKAGLKVFDGVELTTREEAHCIALLPDPDAAEELQRWIDTYIFRVKNNPEKLGDQVWVDSREQIAGEVAWYLNAPIDRSVEQVAEQVVQLGGVFIPAHIDRMANSVVGQLGFLPSALPIAAVEYNHAERFARLRAEQPNLDKYTAYTASDAHFVQQIGTNPSWLYAEQCTFDSLRRAMAAEEGRSISSRQEKL